MERKMWLGYEPVWDEDVPSDTQAPDIFIGTVTQCAIIRGEIIELVYADGRTVRIELQQCKTHYCDNTGLMLVETKDDKEAGCAS